ncbi:unnamed protein product [Scytosiphon promiscuus]
MGSVFSCVLDDDALDKHELERLNMLKKGERSVKRVVFLKEHWKGRWKCSAGGHPDSYR